MQLDTGSDFVRLVDSHRDLAVLRPGAGIRAEVSGPTPLVMLPGRLESLEIGDLRIAGVPVVAEMETFEAPPPGVFGTIGTALLRRFHVTIDMLRGKLRLARLGGSYGTGLTDAGAKAMVVFGATPFWMRGSIIHILARLGRGPARAFFLDTGSSAISLDRSVLQKEFGVESGDPRTTPVTGRGIGGRPVPTFWFPLPVPLVLGGTPIHGLVAYADDFAERNLRDRTNVAGAIGLGILSSARISLDFRRYSMSFVLRGEPAGGR